MKKSNKKNQDETPTPILFSLEMSAQFHQKNCSSHRFVKSSRTLTNV